MTDSSLATYRKLYTTNATGYSQIFCLPFLSPSLPTSSTVCIRPPLPLLFTQACAPRWTARRFSTDAQPLGACYASGRQLTNFQFLQPCTGERLTMSYSGQQVKQNQRYKFLTNISLIACISSNCAHISDLSILPYKIISCMDFILPELAKQQHLQWPEQVIE